MREISASILSANHANLAKDIELAQRHGCDSIHVDVADGHYTKELLFGVQLVRDLSHVTDLPLGIHIAALDQEKIIQPFLKTHAESITFQFEPALHPERLIREIRDSGKKVGIAITPATRYEEIEYYLDEIDIINVLCVEPGEGGQRYNEKVSEKIKRIRDYLDRNQLSTRLAVDGGVNHQTIQVLRDLGAEVFIMGSAIFSGASIGENLENIKKQMEGKEV